ncbi:unnamed protein product, partial [Cuscuta europaea]
MPTLKDEKRLMPIYSGQSSYSHSRFRNVNPEMLRPGESCICYLILNYLSHTLLLRSIMYASWPAGEATPPPQLIDPADGGCHIYSHQACGVEMSDRGRC